MSVALGSEAMGRQPALDLSHQLLLLSCGLEQTTPRPLCVSEVRCL